MSTSIKTSTIIIASTTTVVAGLIGMSLSLTSTFEDQIPPLHSLLEAKIVEEALALPHSSLSLPTLIFLAVRHGILDTRPNADSSRICRLRCLL